MATSDNDEDGADDEEVTRCICGNIDLVTDESDYEDTGLFVQCDNCLVWQHGYCVGLLNDSQMPETYHCELCRPDLHQLIQRPRRRKRSIYLGLDGKGNRTLSPAAGTVRPITAETSPPGTATGGAPTDKVSSSHGSSFVSAITKRERDPSPPSLPRHRTTTAEAAEEESASVRRRRNTMNSRDAAYDRQLEAALLLSAQQSGAGTGATAPSMSGRSGRSTKRRASPSGLSKRTRTPSPSPSRDSDSGSKQKRRKKGVAGDAAFTTSSAQPKREETQESSVSTGRRGGGRKPGPAALRKASSRAKDLMQDVEEESRDDVRSIASDLPTQGRHRGSIVATQGSQPGSRQGSREGTPANQTGSDMAAPTSRKRDRRGGGGAGKKASDRAAAAAAAASMMAGSSTRSSSSGQHAATASSMVGIGGNLIGTSGRLVPLGEMRKRVSAILEYIGRCQVEMAAEKDEWVRWRRAKEDDTNVAETGDTTQLVSKIGRGKQTTNGKLDTNEVWSYGEGSEGSVELMEKLTNTLLQWESQYGS